MNIFCQIASPIGRLTLTADGAALTGLYMDTPNKHTGQHRIRCEQWSERPDDAILAAAARQLEEYFTGSRQLFDLPLRLQGTEFQRRVWDQLTRIPYGQTWSYGQLAKRLENPNACRAVGLANGRNPIAVIVPCHRVIGADGTLTGFGGGLERKQWLLAHEELR